MSASEIDAAIEGINQAIAAAPEEQLQQLHAVIRLHSVLQSPAHTHPTIEEFGNLLANYIGHGLQSGEVVALPFLPALIDLCRTILAIFPHDPYPDQWRSAAHLNLGVLLHCEAELASELQQLLVTQAQQLEAETLQISPSQRQAIHFSIGTCLNELNDRVDLSLSSSIVFHFEQALGIEEALQRGPQIVAAHLCIAEILLTAMPEADNRAERIQLHANAAVDLSEAARDIELLAPSYFILASMHESFAEIEPETHLRPAIAAAQKACDYFDEGSEEWANSQLVLGATLATLGTTPFPWKTADDQASNGLAIEALCKALTLMSPEKDIDKWGRANLRLGWVYAETPDERGVNLYEKAIPCYKRALEAMAIDDPRGLAALTTYKLASSIAQSEPVEKSRLEEARMLVEQARTEFERQGNPILVASANYMRGIILSKLSDNVEGADRTALCDEALQEFDSALTVLTAQLMPPVHAEILTMSAVTMRFSTFESKAARLHSQSDRLEKAIEILRDLPPTLQLSKALMARANCRLEIVEAENEQIEAAIVDSQQAIDTATEFGSDLFVQTSMLVKGHALLAKGARNEDLQTLIDAESIFSNALQNYGYATTSVDWIELALRRLQVADTLSEVGRPSFLSEIVATLENLVARGDIKRTRLLADVHFRLGLHYYHGRSANIDTNMAEAEGHCRTAAALYKRIIDRQNESNALGNLALVLASSPVGDVRSNRREAFEICQAAIHQIEKSTDPDRYAMVCNHLAAIISMQIARGEINERALIFALFHAFEATSVWTKERSPLRWARMHINIGVMIAAAPQSTQTYQSRQSRENIAEALFILDREKHPQEWLIGNYNLGLIVSIAASDEDLESAREAIRLLTLVEEEIKTLHPFMYPRLCKFKGFCFQHMESHDDALQEFENSAAACVTLSAQAIYPDARTRLIHANQGLAAAALVSGARSGQTLRAIFIADRSRAVQQRLFFNRDRRRWLDATDAERSHLNSILGELEALEEEARTSLRSRSRSFSEIQGELLDQRDRFNSAAAGYGLRTAEATWSEKELLLHVPESGGLVFLAGGAGQGEAIIVKRDAERGLSLVTVALPGASQSEVREWLRDWLEAYREFRDCIASEEINPDFDAIHDKTEREMGKLLETLWSVVMQPVSDALDNEAGTISETASAKPVLKIVPLEDFQLLPLHAAGVANDNGAWEGIDSSFAVSYWANTVTQSFDGKYTGRESASSKDTSDLRFLGVLSPATAEWEEGEFEESALAERALLEATFGDQESRVYLTGKTATSDNLRAAILEGPTQPTHLHFSCHGEFDWEEPLESGLILADDETLTIADISDIPLGGCQLVMLAACETAMIDVIELPDELISLPAAFTQAGAKNVIGAQWLIPDEETTALLDQFYPLHIQQAASSAHALRNSVRLMRNGTADPTRGESTHGEGGHFLSPLTWAAFAHYSL